MRGEADVEAGRAVPIKWQISDGMGGFVNDLGVVTSLHSARVACANVDGVVNEIDIMEAETTGNSGLRYDTTNEQFVFNWKTAKSQGGSCDVFILSLVDRNQHKANFELK